MPTRPAKKRDDFPAAVDASKAKHKRPANSFEGQTFEGLNNAEKDQLLKEVAIKLGMIEDS